MDDDQETRVELLYGHAKMALQNPQIHGVIVGPPEPRNALEAVWWTAQGVLYEVVIPAFLFALAWTLLTMPFWLR